MYENIQRASTSNEEKARYYSSSSSYADFNAEKSLPIALYFALRVLYIDITMWCLGVWPDSNVSPDFVIV